MNPVSQKPSKITLTVTRDFHGNALRLAMVANCFCMVSIGTPNQDLSYIICSHFKIVFFFPWELILRMIRLSHSSYHHHPGKENCNVTITLHKRIKPKA